MKPFTFKRAAVAMALACSVLGGFGTASYAELHEQIQNKGSTPISAEAGRLVGAALVRISPTERRMASRALRSTRDMTSRTPTAVAC